MVNNERSRGSSSSGAGPRGKVGKLIDRHGLDDIGDELVDAWTSETDERESLRELAKRFNEALLARALEDATGSTLDGEATNFYRLLTSEEVTSGTRIEARNRLEARGVDVNTLEDEFVSRQSIHTYLTKERNVAYATDDKSDETRVEDRVQTVQRLKNRLVAVAEQTLSELATSGPVSTGKSRVVVLVRVQCEDCGVQHPFTEFVRNGGCQCSTEQN